LAKPVFLCAEGAVELGAQILESDPRGQRDHAVVIKMGLERGDLRWGEAKRADFVLSHKPGIRLAVIEAKDNNHPVGGGMQQALEYGDTCGGVFNSETAAWSKI
jgi:hypothetical protein